MTTGAGTLSVRDVCDRYGMSQHTVLAWIARGELRAINVARRLGAKRSSWRITPTALDAWESMRTASAAPSPRRRRMRTHEISYY